MVAAALAVGLKEESQAEQKLEEEAVMARKVVEAPKLVAEAHLGALVS